MNTEVARAWVEALGKISRSANVAAATIERLAVRAQGHEAWEELAIGILKDIGPVPIPITAEALGDPELGIRAAAVAPLRKSPRSGRRVGGTDGRSYDDRCHRPRGARSRSGPDQCDPRAHRSREVMIQQQTRDVTTEVVRACVEALGKIGPEAAEALPVWSLLHQTLRGRCFGDRRRKDVAKLNPEHQQGRCPIRAARIFRTPLLGRRRRVQSRQVAGPRRVAMRGKAHSSAGNRGDGGFAGAWFRGMGVRMSSQQSKKSLSGGGLGGRAWVYAGWMVVAAVLATASLATAVPARAQNRPPVVSNVTASQRTDASKLVDIVYDLADADGDTCTVTVVASDDSGATWGVPIAAVSGAVGSGIPPGAGKHIVWDPAADIPGLGGTSFKVRVCAFDGHTPGSMVPIPAGEFLMGCHAETGESCYSDELPVHAVYLSAFYMDVYEVTNQQYADALNWAWTQGGLIQVTSGVVYKYGDTSILYCDTTGSSPDSRITWNGSTFGVVAGKEDHPMVDVTWYGAAACSNWRSAMEGRTPSYDTTMWECNFDGDGYRLPTEAEWECAARGGEHDPYYTYPWGNTIDGSNANYWNSGDPYETGPYPWTTPVGYYDGNQTPPGTDMANGYGLYDMAGNVWEWCNDWYSSTYYGSSPYDNPRGPATGTYRVLRGGSWSYDGFILRCALRGITFPGERFSLVGIRLALD